MKKVLFCLSLVISLSVLGVVPSFAMEYTIYEVGGLSDLGYGLSIGAKFDFEDTRYTIRDLQNLTQQRINELAEEKARAWLYDYCFDRQIPLPSNDPNLPTDVYSYFKSNYFDNRVNSMYRQYQVALEQGYIDAEGYLRMPISKQSVADWALYNPLYYNVYTDSFGIPDDSNPTVEIPSEYSYIENINTLYTSGYGYKYNFLDYTGVCFDLWGGTVSINGSLRDHSYISSNFISAARTDPTNLNYDCRLKSTGVSPLMRIDISSGSPTTVTYSTYANLLNNTIFTWVNNPNSGTYGSFNFYINSSRTSRPTVSDANYSAFNYKQNSFNSLSDALQYIYSHYANIDLYVDGDAWIIAGGDAPANPTIPEFPDIINPDSDDPIDLVDLPYTSNYEGTFDITSLFDAIKEAIIGASDNDDSTSSILSGDAVKDTFRDTTGELVGDVAVPLEDVIDDSFPIDDTINYPNLPLPDEPIHNAFSGTTVLAQLIHATDVVMPDGLMIVFWGILFILFIIGLIKILHK